MAERTRPLITHCPPGYVVNLSSHKTLRETTCPICIDHFDGQQSLFRMYGCHHVFHEDCIMPWLSKKNTCPMCRRVMPPFLRKLSLPLPHGFRLPPQPPDTMPLQVPEQQPNDDTDLHLNFYIRPDQSVKHEKNLSQTEIDYLNKIFSAAGYPDDWARHYLMALARAPFSVVRGVSFVD